MGGGDRTRVDEQWLLERGGLHDARILDCHVEDGDLVLRLDDQWSNFRNLDGDPGRQPGALVIASVQNHPDLDPLLREMLLDVELVRSGSDVGLRFHTLVCKPIELLGRSISWHPSDIES